MPRRIAELLKDPRSKATLLDMEIAGNPRSLSLVRRILATCALSQNLQTQQLNDVKLAVSEACTNVIKHAFRFDQTRKFGLMVQVSAQFYYVQLVYQDGMFDPNTIPVPDLDDIQEGGLGVYIMRNIMDLVEYSVDETTKTVILRMVKMIGSGDALGSVSEGPPKDSGGQGENRIPR